MNNEVTQCQELISLKTAIDSEDGEEEIDDGFESKDLNIHSKFTKLIYRFSNTLQ